VTIRSTKFLDNTPRADGVATSACGRFGVWRARRIADHRRVRFSQWASEATSLLGELLHDLLEAERMVADLLAGRPMRFADAAEMVAELRQILDANIDLMRAEY
jgi:hypothetical protein